MHVPMSWLREMVELPPELTVEELAERLTVAGLEVAKVIYLGIPQSENRHGVPPSDHLVWDREKLVLGSILEVTQHPNADRLVLAEVEYGADETETVVTGAPNLFQFLGQGRLDPPPWTPFALEGTEVIDGHGDGVSRMILQEKELRGIPNRCMVCSEMELGISEAHEGIMLIPQGDLPDASAGQPLQDVLGDAVLDIELTPNLARCFSILGVAREAAALYDVPLHTPDWESLPATSGDPVENTVRIDIRNPELNPRFTAAMLRNVTIKDSPWWMQWRLKLVGQRPINNIVDVSNYVMFEIGQPTHAFDYDILQRRADNAKPTIITRLPDAGETLTTLDGKTHQLNPDVLLVADDNGALSLAGVMGGLESEVQEPEGDYPGSQTVLLEAAAWDLITIRKTTSSTKQYSEAATRFSRGVHPEMALRGLKRGLQLMLAVSGATLAPGILDEYPAKPEPVVVEFPLSETERLLGFEIPRDDVVAILQRLQFTVEEKDADTIWVTVPDHRLDIGTGIIGRADLVEEIARVYGYNRINNTIMEDALPPQRGNYRLEMENRISDLLAESGMRQVINYRFTTPEHESKLTPAGLHASWPQVEYVRLANPSSSERTVLRQTLLVNLLDNAAINMHHHPQQQLFEIGNVYHAKPQGLPDEPARLGILMMGGREVTDWTGTTSAGKYDFYDLKGVVELVLEALHIPLKQVGFEPVVHNSFHPGRVARLCVDGYDVGVLGEVHPLVREAFGLGLDLDTPVLAAELNFDTLLERIPEAHQVVPIPTTPPVYRDIALVVEDERPAADIESLIWQFGGDLLRSVTLFDVYSGDPIPAGQKSLAYALVFQSDTETLSDKKVNKVFKKIVSSLEAEGATLRS